MRVTKFVRSDGENWQMVRIRASAQCPLRLLYAAMEKNGWIRWSRFRTRLNILKKKVAAGNPTKYPNWKEVRIPMMAASLKDLPEQFNKHITLENLEGDIGELPPLLEDIPLELSTSLVTPK